MTLFGGADLNYRSVKSGDNKFTGMAQDGIYSSRLGFRGVEDLGGGLSANFHFEGGMNPDNGTAGGFNFARKSTIGVASKDLGEVRLGRDYTPLFTIAGIADPFGTNGVGSSYNVASGFTLGLGEPGFTTPQQNYLAAVTASASSFVTAQAIPAANAAGVSSVQAGLVIADPAAVRANNSIAYYSPSFGGFSVSAMYGLGNENTTAAKKAGRVTSFKLAYANGPISAAFGNQTTKGGATGAAVGVVAPFPAIAAFTPTDDQKYTTNFLAASYDFGVAKVSAGYKTDKLDFGAIDISGTAKSTILGVSAPLGAFTLKASYVSRKVEGEKLATQTAFGGIYDLSKRTALYSTYSVLNNEEGSGLNVGSAAASNFNGVKSKGFEFGVRQTF